MGYPVPDNAPHITINGRTLAIAAFLWQNPVGNFYVMGIYEKQSDGSYNQEIATATYPNPGDFIADVKVKGGIVKFKEFIVSKTNAHLAQMFGASPTPTPTVGEPTTDDEALAYMMAHFSAMTVTVINNVPVFA